MRVVSFMNYKGGVGKTTIAANLGAGLAKRGHRVLMLDLDPQTNLTFSFYSIPDWELQVTSNRSIKRWFDAQISNPGRVPRLSELVTTPHANSLIGPDGRLDLISSDLRLLDIDMRLAAKLHSADAQMTRVQHVRMHRMLADALEDEDITRYDYVLIDCAPDFGVVTRIAMVASDFLLVPAKPDRLSTMGISHFVGSLRELVREQNSLGAGVPKINPRFLGVVFTMIQVYGGQPTYAQQKIIERTARAKELPVFESMLRNANRAALASTESGIPAVLGSDAEIVAELNALTKEFIERVESMT
ncbi:MAG TPA: AAA family ATPase [Candidatus Limnocylindrales bacterium]